MIVHLEFSSFTWIGLKHDSSFSHQPVPPSPSSRTILHANLSATPQSGQSDNNTPTSFNVTGATVPRFHTIAAMSPASSRTFPDARDMRGDGDDNNKAPSFAEPMKKVMKE